ncbi:MAG TPA: serpin family protein [Bacteroidia bacterium]|nr:serpin family protein [Bacteroidia bacterium]
MKAGLAAIAGLIMCNVLSAQQPFSIADSNNLFAFKLYGELKKDTKENLFFSPFSISSALAMTYAGARNETEKQMCHTLHFSSDQNAFHKAYKTYLEKIESDTGKDLALRVANSLWIANSFELLKPFSEIEAADYKAESYNVAFSPPAAIEDTRLQINYWVEQRTKKKIKDLIPPGILDLSTKLVLVDAIYFKGKWKIAFSKDSTKMGEFYADNTGSVNADFMHTTANYKYYEDNVLQAIEFPYSGDKLSMVVFLPKKRDGIEEMNSKIDYAFYTKIVSGFLMSGTRKVIVALPKFKTTAEFRMAGTLSAMGMPDAFSPGLADFKGMSTDQLCISQVIHKAFIEVNDEGTEAAAATAVIMKMMMSPIRTPLFIADHPFVFVIRDNATGGILFMGKISNTVKE